MMGNTLSSRIGEHTYYCLCIGRHMCVVLGPLPPSLLSGATLLAVSTAFLSTLLLLYVRLRWNATNHR